VAALVQQVLAALLVVDRSSPSEKEADHGEHDPSNARECDGDLWSAEEAEGVNGECCGEGAEDVDER
jgi:hypothetical protein